MSAMTTAQPVSAEAVLMDRFMDDHGDPSEWTRQMALDYVAALEALWAQELRAAITTTKKASV
jgi:hypothetical protein